MKAWIVFEGDCDGHWAIAVFLNEEDARACSLDGPYRWVSDPFEISGGLTPVTFKPRNGVEIVPVMDGGIQ